VSNSSWLAKRRSSVDFSSSIEEGVSPKRLASQLLFDTVKSLQPLILSFREARIISHTSRLFSKSLHPAGYLKYVPVSTDTGVVARDWAPMLNGAELFCASKQGFKLIALLFLAMLD